MDKQFKPVIKYFHISNEMIPQDLALELARVIGDITTYISSDPKGPGKRGAEYMRGWLKSHLEILIEDIERRTKPNDFFAMGVADGLVIDEKGNLHGKEIMH